MTKYIIEWEENCAQKWQAIIEADSKQEAMEMYLSNDCEIDDVAEVVDEYCNEKELLNITKFNDKKSKTT